MSNKKVTGKDLERLIENVLSEKLNIELPDRNPHQQNKGWAKELATKLQITPEDYKTTGRKDPSDPKKFISLVRKQVNANTFDFKDLKTLTTKDRKIIKDKFLDTTKPLPSKSNVYRFNVADSPYNVLILDIFFINWDKMSKQEQERFNALFVHEGNYPVLKRTKFAQLFSDKWSEIEQNVSQSTKHAPVTQTTTDDPSFTSTNLQTGLADSAKMKEDERAIFSQFQTMLGVSGSDLVSKLGALTKFSNYIVDGSFRDEVTSGVAGEPLSSIEKARKFITYTSVLDIFNNFAKNIDHGAGAYYFEAFLAYLAGGKAGGKLSGVGGGMGESDFIKADGSKGSAKYYQKGSELTQSWKNFVPGQPVEYIIAYKEDAQGNPTSDLDALYRIALFSFTVEAENVNGKLIPKINGNELLDISSVSSGAIKLTDFKRMWKRIGDFVLPQTAQKSLSQWINKSAEATGQATEQFTSLFEEAIKNLRGMKTSTVKYATKGDANNSLKAITQANSFINNINAMQNTEANSQNITEGKKITAEQLKKLIQESFK